MPRHWFSHMSPGRHPPPSLLFFLPWAIAPPWLVWGQRQIDEAEPHVNWTGQDRTGLDRSRKGVQQTRVNWSVAQSVAADKEDSARQRQREQQIEGERGGEQENETARNGQKAKSLKSSHDAAISQKLLSSWPMRQMRFLFLTPSLSLSLTLDGSCRVTCQLLVVSGRVASGVR